VTRVPTLESRIDDLYALRLDEFVAARAALAAELKGAEARRIKELKKPTSVPWAVNQVYWHARGAFERLQHSGTALRRAQVAALEGQSANVHVPIDVHRKAMTSAVEQAMKLSEAAGIHPSRDGLTRTFEALSLASRPPEPPGRLTRPLQPGGFEMLAGVEPARPGAPGKGFRPASPDAEQVAAVERTRERDAAAATRRRDAAIASLERAVLRAKENAALARRAWDRATDELAAAEQRLVAMRDSRQDVDPSGA
jgi:hypothetical protein